MTALATVAAAVGIAFPRMGQQLPYVERCYMNGWASDGATNVIVQGRNVPVHPLGGWVTMVDCAEGTNVIAVGEASVTFVVAARPSSGVDLPPPVYAKLPYAGDEPRTNRLGAVVIDAGHGGSDTGAISPHGLKEKDVNLRIARAVRDELVKKGVRVVMTRDDDSFPALYDRPKVAHSNDAAAFVSIHHNAPPLDKDPRKLRYHTVYAWNPIGAELAGRINARMAEAFGTTLRNNGVQHANYAVTRNPEIPSCLIEVDFITTPEGELDAWNFSRGRRVAVSIASGIADWRSREREVKK